MVNARRTAVNAFHAVVVFSVRVAGSGFQKIQTG